MAKPYGAGLGCVLMIRTGYPSKGDRYRERSRSPMRNGPRDRSRTPPSRGPRPERRGDRRGPRAQANGTPDTQRPSRPRDEMEMDVDAGDDDIEGLMRKSMGFTRFRSTKNTQVPGNDIYGVRKEKKTEYRQYMNRPGGFNRPLSP
jgi:U4/U6.U5 tri-snRNP-associated protein 3